MIPYLKKSKQHTEQHKTGETTRKTTNITTPDHRKNSTFAFG
jgi:hypothetical protein